MPNVLPHWRIEARGRRWLHPRVTNSCGVTGWVHHPVVMQSCWSVWSGAGRRPGGSSAGTPVLGVGAARAPREPREVLRKRLDRSTVGGVSRVRGVAGSVVSIVLVVTAVVVGVLVLKGETSGSREQAVRDRAVALLEGVVRRDVRAVCDHATSRGLTAIADVATQDPGAEREVANARRGNATARRFCVALIGGAVSRRGESRRRYERAMQQARDGDARVDVHGRRATIRFRRSPGQRDRGTLTLVREHNTWRFDHAGRSQFFNRASR